MAEVKIYTRVVEQTIPTIKFNGVEDIQAVTDFIIRHSGKIETVLLPPKDREEAAREGWHEGEVAWWRILKPNNDDYVYQLILKPGDVVAKKNGYFETVFIDGLEADGFKEVTANSFEELHDDKKFLC